VKHYINEIDNSSAIIQSQSMSSDQWESADLDIPIKIEKFPSEFKKNIFETFDKRFLFILLISIVLNIGTILILNRILPSEVSSKTITRIQEQYAKLLLTNGLQPSPYFLEAIESDYKLDTQLITGLNKWLDTFTSSILESIKDNNYKTL